MWIKIYLYIVTQVFWLIGGDKSNTVGNKDYLFCKSQK